ncbi:MAG: glycosyltransferase [Candidatus Eremiobacteraeota bacterium]|nr:glycosyltransferase [Candidatus Eremiobacteraeota bacterium]
MAIEALAVLRERYNARLTIIGRIFDGAYLQRCIARSTELGLENFVTFTGSLSQREISEHFSRGRIGVHTALEGATRSSGSLLSMFAHGLPVIALKTDHDDVEFNDLLKQSDADAHSLAHAIGGMLEDSAGSEALGRRASQRYGAAFDWRAITSAAVPQLVTKPFGLQ